MIADAVKSRGRSRPGHLAGAAMTVATASGRQHTPTACSRRKAPSHIYLQQPTKNLKAGWLESDRPGRSRERGNTPRWALFLPLNFSLRNLELLLRQLEFLLAVVGFLSPFLERRAHECGEPDLQCLPSPARRRLGPRDRDRAPLSIAANLSRTPAQPSSDRCHTNSVPAVLTSPPDHRRTQVHVPQRALRSRPLTSS